MLVVADELAVGVTRQGRLSGARQTEEQRRIAVIALVARAVHRQHILFGHQPVHQREDALFHLTGVLGAEDDHLVGFQVQRHAGVGVDALDVRVRRKLAGIEDGEVRLAELVELGVARPPKHVVHKQRVVGAAGHDPDLPVVVAVPSGKRVDHVEAILLVQIVDRPVAVRLEGLRAQRHVDVAPPDLVGTLGVLDDPLVLGGAARLLAGVRDQSAR